MSKRLCPECGVAMDPEWDRDFEVWIWSCPSCFRTHIEGSSE